jgi:hypothetical protein
MFNPNPRVQAVAITPRQTCYVIDDALAEPQRWVEYAVAHRDGFRDFPDNAFPGPELRFPQPVLEAFAAFFNTHVRQALGARRLLRAAVRMSMTTRDPQDLRPAQWICHIDAMGMQPGQMIGACVLYLFDRPELGGTAFYMPTRPMDETMALMQASSQLPPERFAAEYGIAPGYMTDSNAWFQKVARIPARFNRLIFYSGTVLHSGEILNPQLLDPDPRKGRLTINGFFTCTRRASAAPLQSATAA